MASCKDCVHADMCKYKDLPAPLSDSYIRESECIEKRCGDFKDRSRFVELPFHIGDDVYCTRMFKIYKKTVEKIELDDDGIAVVTEDGYCYDLSICFRSQKDAEKALKERETNE